MERLAHYLVGVAAVVAVAASGTALAGAVLNLGPALESDFAQTIVSGQQMAAVDSATASTQGTTGGNSLTEAQIQAITSLLVSFNVDPATIATVDGVLRHTTPAASQSEGDGTPGGQEVQGGHDGAEASSTRPAFAGVVAACVRIDHALGRGSDDASSTGQVHELQKFLADHFGLNENDLVTGFFGSTTQALVTKFQDEQGIDSVGSVGPQTRTAMLRFCGGTASSTPGMMPPRPPHPRPDASSTRPMYGPGDNTQNSDNQQSNSLGSVQNAAAVSEGFGEIGDGLNKLVGSYFALFGL